MSSLLFNPDFRVIDESANWIVVDKPPHLLSHPNKPGNPPTLLDGLAGLLGFEIANGAQLSVITRLDRDTSGLVLVAKNPDTARELSLAIQSGQIDKEYLALVWGWPEADEWEVDAPILRLGEVEPPQKIWLKRGVHPDGKPSRTRFQVESRFERETTNGTRFSLIRAFPRTGRMHQIRIHLAHSGFPIIGDKIYGPDERNYLEFIETGWTKSLAERLLLDRHALHANVLQYASQVWTAPLPPDMADFAEPCFENRRPVGCLSLKPTPDSTEEALVIFVSSTLRGVFPSHPEGSVDLAIVPGHHFVGQGGLVSVLAMTASPV